MTNPPQMNTDERGLRLCCPECEAALPIGVKPLQKHSCHGRVWIFGIRCQRQGLEWIYLGKESELAA
jgi:hypothetical protein